MLLGRLSKWLNKPAMQRLLGYLQIGFSASCGIVCLLMIACWVRSYTWADGFFLRLVPSGHVQVHAGDGRMCIWLERQPIDRWFSSSSRLITEKLPPPDDENRIPWLDIYAWPNLIRIYTTHWLLTVVAGSLAVIPWCPRKFTLRGLFVVMTVIAAVVGVIVWVDKTF
jgi:hypothetical protein